MTQQTFQIYYGAGLKDGVDELQAIEKLAAMLKMPQASAAKIIRTTGRVVKGGLNHQQAERYLQALDGLGMQVEIRAEHSEQEASPALLSERDEPDNDVVASRAEVASPSVREPIDQSPVTEASTDELKPVEVEFHGKGFEYFKIWIVNIFLTIITLGIYSAWAKVRSKQYFYGNTQIDGSSFHYTARPITILKGRLIAVAVFLVYYVISEFIPLLGMLLTLAFVVIIPWLVVRSLAFNARNSVYRNIRFNFTGKAIEALKVFVLWPILMLPTFGLILPYLWYRQNRFIVDNSAYGTSAFTFAAEARDYFRVFLMVLGGLLAIGAVMGLLVMLVGPQVMLLSGPLSVLVYLLLFAYLAAALGNIYFNYSSLNNHGFHSSLQTGKMAWLYLTNTLAIVFTLGLMIPWAQVRMARYRAECLQLLTAGSLDSFVAAEQKQVSALGEEMGEVFDFEVSFV